MRATRHAKNFLRKHKFSMAQVELALIGKQPHDFDPDGRPRFLVTIEGVRLRVVFAVDIPNFIVTVHDWDRNES